MRSNPNRYKLVITYKNRNEEDSFNCANLEEAREHVRILRVKYKIKTAIATDTEICQRRKTPHRTFLNTSV